MLLEAGKHYYHARENENVVGCKTYIIMRFGILYSQQFKCCGLSTRSYEDWSKNEYFNCTGPELNPSVERCGVPYSCCKNATDMSVRFPQLSVE